MAHQELFKKLKNAKNPSREAWRRLLSHAYYHEVTRHSKIKARRHKFNLAFLEGIFTTMRQLTVLLVTDYNLMIQACSKYPYGLITARKYFDMISEDHLEADRESYTALAHAFVKHGKGYKVENLFELMQASGIDMTLQCYNILLDSIMQPGSPAGRPGVGPQALGLADGSRHRVASEIMMAAQTLLEHMYAHGCTPDNYSYHTLLTACAKKRDVENAQKVRAQMSRAGIRPTFMTLLLMLQANRNRSDVRAVRHIWDSFTQKYNVQPTVACFNEALHTYAKCGDRGEAEHCIEAMSACGLSPDIITYNCLMACYAKGGHFKEAEGLLVEMKLQGQLPDIETYNGLIQAYTAVEMMDSASGVLSRISADHLVLDAVTLHSLLRGYLQQHLFEEAQQLYEAHKEVANMVCFNEMAFYLKAHRQGDTAALLQSLRDIHNYRQRHRRDSKQKRWALGEASANLSFANSVKSRVQRWSAHAGPTGTSKAIVQSTLLVPKAMLPQLIGSRGRTIQQVQIRTGALIHIANPTFGHPDVEVKCTGSAQAVASAMYHVETLCRTD